jgi:hypothetical protein
MVNANILIEHESKIPAIFISCEAIANQLSPYTHSADSLAVLVAFDWGVGDVGH